MFHSIPQSLVALLIGLAALAIPADPVHAQFTLYDDFNSGQIDPARWSASSIEGNSASPTGAAIRTVVKPAQSQRGALLLGLESHGRTDSDSGVALSRQQLNMVALNPFITGIQAKVTVLNASAENCAANSTVGSTSARLLAIFFNDGTSPNPSTSAIGNVLGMLALQRNTDQTDTIVAYMLRCTSNDCAAATDLPGSPLTFTLGWSINRPIPLSIVWDQAQHRLVYTAGSGGTAETQTLPYTVADTASPAGFDNKQVRVSNFTQNCTADRARNAIEALFDDVSVQRVP